VQADEWLRPVRHTVGIELHENRRRTLHRPPYLPCRRCNVRDAAPQRG
jgi:hypothetical protein